MKPAKHICHCGRTGVHRIVPRCQWPRPWRINPRWRALQAAEIRRRFAAGRSLGALNRDYGRRLVDAAIREGL